MRRRSQLYVPGNNPRMIAKASTLEADSLIFDLEDAVPPEQKLETRKAMGSRLSGPDWGTREVCVRVNAPTTEEGPGDLETVARLGAVRTLVVPKAEGDLSSLSKKTGKGILPIVETARGLARIEDVLRSEGVVAVTYGAGDFAVSVGGTIAAYARNPYVKTRIAVTAAAYGVDAIDAVHFDLRDTEGFRAEALESKALGYVGKQVVHPEQVTLANALFSPDPDELAWAQEIVHAYEVGSRSGKGAIRVRDQLVDAVHYRWAQKVLERAGA